MAMIRSTWIALLCCMVVTTAAAADAHRAHDEALAFNCYACHATVRGSAIPGIRGWTTDRLLSKLLAYKKDPDRAGLMSRIAKGYSDVELRRIAAYIAAHNLRRGDR